MRPGAQVGDEGGVVLAEGGQEAGAGDGEARRLGRAPPNWPPTYTHVALVGSTARACTLPPPDRKTWNPSRGVAALPMLNRATLPRLHDA